MDKQFDLVVKGGSIVAPETGIVQADIGICGEKIVCLGTNLATDGAKVIDATGKSVFPGLIDPHTHIGNKIPIREDFLAESKGAAAGGVTTLLSTLKVVSDLIGGNAMGEKVRTLESYEDFFPKAQKVLDGAYSHIDYAWHFTPGSLAEAKKADDYYRTLGVQSYKFYMAYTKRMASPGMTNGELYAVLQMWAKLKYQPLAMMHCESDEINDVATETARKSGMTGLAAWNAARPNISEELAIRTACLLARRAGARLYIVHMSTKEGVETVAEAQHQGVRIIGETCPHYLALTDESPRALGKVNPPVRKQADADALWRGIERRVVTCVGTDHVSAPTEAKTNDIWTATPAFPGMETTLPVMITEAIKRGIPLTRVAEVCSFNNARAFGLLPKKGTIAVGSDADLTIVDLNKRKTITSSGLWSAAKFTPFDGKECVGWPVLTMLRGQVIFENNKIVGRPLGRYVPIYPA